MSMWSDLVANGLVPILKETHGDEITIEDVETGEVATVTAYHGTGDYLGAVDEKQERNFAGMTFAELPFTPRGALLVTDEHSQEGTLMKARRTNHGTWELQVWRGEEIA